MLMIDTPALGKDVAVSPVTSTLHTILNIEVNLRVIETMRNKIEQIVEQACAADTNIFGYDIWTHHLFLRIGNPRIHSGEENPPSCVRPRRFFQKNT